MDTLTEVKARVQAGICGCIQSGGKKTCREQYGVGSWCSACLGHALLAAPVPSPSADARAKLEQAVKEWRDAKVLVSSYPRWLDLSASEKRNYFKAREELKAAEAALLALPPHEGETPQPESAERTLKSICAMLGWENVPPRETLEREIAALKSRALAHRAAPPETPQPAAESGWREMNTTLCRLANLLKHGRRDQGRIERIIEEIRNLAAIAATHASLPPVVQTRPEEPR